MFKVGDTVDGRYLVEAEIGRGGMGVVLQAVDQTTGDHVALKFCPSNEDEQLRRFAREVRVMASIVHENVMPVLSHNLTYAPPYFTMPLATRSIAEEIAAGISEDEALGLFKEICNGIQATHNAGTTHRDIKPLNAMRLPDGRVVVSDMGLARLDERDTTTITQAAQFLGTRAYCAPEQLLPGGSRDADARTDVYQLGKTLYEVLTGESPALIDHSHLPRGLGYIVERATREQPIQRYQTVGAMMDAIETYNLGKAPGASPSSAFDAALDEAKARLKANEYRQENLEAVATLALPFAEESKVLLEQFDRIPNEVLSVMARNTPEALLALLTPYCAAIEDIIGSYHFEYAQVVAEKMNVIFSKTTTPAIKALAIRATLTAAVRLNRYAAMDDFDSMLLLVSETDDALAIADVLRDEIDLYRVVASRIPRAKLHAMLRPIYDSILQSQE
jgi:eukaryotic-like serine/threonine-protein kinase